MDFYLEIIQYFFVQNLLLFSLVVFACAFVLSLKSFPLIVYISYFKNIIVVPNERSSHNQKTPYLGGLGISFGSFFVSSFFGALILSGSDLSIVLAITSALILLLTAGIKDDIIGLSPLKKIIIEVVSALIFILLTDIRIDNFYGLFGINEISVFISYIFTIFVFIIIINSYNLIDGIDGLAASLAILILSILLFYFISTKMLLPILAISSMLGALVAFMRYNLFSVKRKIFMGDGGSLVVGFTLAYLSIMVLNTSLTESSFNFPHKPVFILSLFAFPLLDTLRVMILRVYNKKSPFCADKNHLHHLFLKNGFTHLKSTIFITLYSLLVIIISFYFSDYDILKHFIFSLIGSIVILFMLILILKIFHIMAIV